jgi:hypothetical protein
VQNIAKQLVLRDMDGKTLLNEGVAVTDPDTQVLWSDFCTALSFNYTRYPAGYVHFLKWINGRGVNDYEVLRNQFIHMQVTGMNQDNEGVFSAGGYPGQEPEKSYDANGNVVSTGGDAGNPKKPVNPNAGIEDEPINPAPTLIQVNVKVNPWTYRLNEIELGK